MTESDAAGDTSVDSGPEDLRLCEDRTRSASRLRVVLQDVLQDMEVLPQSDRVHKRPSS